MDSSGNTASETELGQGPGPRLLACVAEPDSRGIARDLAAAQGWRNPVAIEGGIVAAHDYITKHAPPNLLIVDIDDVEDPVKALADLADLCPPEMTVIALGKRNELTLYRELIELGVTDYVLKPVTLAMLERSLRGDNKRQLGQGTAKTQAHVVSFVSVRGGAGATTVAGSVAWCLSHIYQKRVALIDLDLQFGNLALSLDLVPASGLREALEFPSRLDSRLLGTAMLEESPRLKVLAAEEPLVDQMHVAPGAIDTMLNVLRHDYDFVVVDMPRVLSDEIRRTLTLSGTIGLVTDLSLASARDLLRLSDFAKTMTPSARHLIVANHVGAKHRGEIAKVEFERVTAVKIDHVVPFEPTAALATASTGSVLSATLKHAPAAAAMRAIAMHLAGIEPAAAKSGSVLAKLPLGKLTLPAKLSPRAFLPSFLKRSA
ncbi:MAG: AAA family ATPase [Alphaproteobacteria bacterium]|nr:AAA family ATPase [Alphaproteobacteria bacterium]